MCAKAGECCIVYLLAHCIEQPNVQSTVAVGVLCRYSREYSMCGEW